MKLTVIREIKQIDRTIGKLYIDGQYICNTMEDTDRGLDDSMDEETILKGKIKDETAIPTGTYRITMDVKSPKFDKMTYYHNFCDGKLPRLLNVKGFEGILIHRGTGPEHCSGCVLLGYYVHKTNRLDNSQVAFEKVYNLMKNEKDIVIEIK